MAAKKETRTKKTTTTTKTARTKSDSQMIKNGQRLYPLVVAQKFHLFYQAMSPKKEIVNIGLSLTIGTDVDLELLKASIYKAYDRQESMRIRFTRADDGEVYQYIAEKEERDIEYVNFWGKSMEEAEATLTQWSQIPFDLEDSPLNRVVMITMPDGFNGVYFLAHHMTMDAQSIIMFLRDVIEIYCSEIYDDIPFPKEMSSYIEQLKKDLDYEAGSKIQQRDKEFFEGMIDESEPLYAGFEGKSQLEAQRKHFNMPDSRGAINLSDSVDATLDTFHLEAEPTQKILDFCEEHHISMVCLLMMGLRTYFQKFNEQDDISINTAIARRATLKEKRCGGTRIHSFPFRTIISKDTMFIDALHQIRDGQNRLFMHANYDPTAYFAYRNKKYPNKPKGATYEPMSLTYQPMTIDRSGMDKLGDIQFKSKWYPNGASVTGVYLTVMHRSADNGLDFNFEHQTKLITREKLEFVYYYLCKIIFAGIEDPQKTVGEIIESV